MNDWTTEDYALARSELGLPDTATAQEIAALWTEREEEIRIALLQQESEVGL